MLFDLAAALGAYLLAYWVRMSGDVIPYAAKASLAEYLLLYVASIPLLLLVFRFTRLYDRHEILTGTGEYVRIINAFSFYVLSVILLSFAFRTPQPSRGWLACLWVGGILLACLVRFMARRFFRKYWNGNRPVERALIIGVNEEARGIADRLTKTGLVEVVGFLDDFGSPGDEIWNGRCVLGAPRHFEQIAARQQAGLAILMPDAIGWEAKREVLSRVSGSHGVEVQVAPGFSDMHLFSMRVGFKGDVPLLRFRAGYIAGFDAVMKSAVDYFLAVLFLIVHTPLMLILSAALLATGGRPVIEGNEVLGVNGGSFRTFKFRTRLQTSDKYRTFHRLVDIGGESSEMSRLEQLLFHTGLDKLPQLFNVLRGEMSLVGPRTISLDAARHYGEWLTSVLAVKPGITGSWAVREARDLDQEIALTLYYVRNWTIWSDFAILAQTMFEMMRTRFRTRVRVRGVGEGEKVRR